MSKGGKEWYKNKKGTIVVYIHMMTKIEKKQKIVNWLFGAPMSNK
jgi:hypothetical protein